MRILLMLFLAVFVFAVTPAQGQEKLSKEEKKELKELMKKYKKDPQALQELVESVDDYREENSNLQSQISSLTSEKQMMESRLEQLEQSNIALNNQLAAAQEVAQEMAAQPQEVMSSAYEQNLAGTLFRVQIGAFRKTHIPDDLDSPDGSMTLENAEGLQKVMVGSFREYQSAKDLMNHLKKIGVDDAWVVAYIDGGRVSLNDVVPREYQ